MENPKTPVVSNTQGNGTEICATDMHTVSTTMLHTVQMWDIRCRKLASQMHHGNKISFKSVIMSENDILQKQQYIYSLKHDITIAPCSLVPTTLHEFHDSKGHQGTVCTFEAIRHY